MLNQIGECVVCGKLFARQRATRITCCRKCREMREGFLEWIKRHELEQKEWEEKTKRGDKE